MNIVYRNTLIQVDKSTFENFIKELHLNGELDVSDCYQFLSPENNVIARADVLNNRYYIWNGNKEEVDLDLNRKKAEEMAQKIVDALKEAFNNGKD